MKNILPYIGLALLALQLWSCEEDAFSQVTTIDLPEHEPRPALRFHVNSADSLLLALVSNSKGILDPDSVYKVPEDASLQIYREGELFETLFFNTERDRYQIFIARGGFPAEAGISYELRADIPGFDPLSISQTMPAKASITAATFEFQGAITPDGDRADEFVVELKDEEPGVLNYYGLQVYQRYGYVDPASPEDTIYYYDNVYLDSNDPTLSYGNEYSFIFTDEAFDGGDFTLRTYSYSSGAIGQAYFARIYTLTRDAYLYERSLDLYWNALDNPFAEPVTVHSNVPNGYGVFSLGNISEKKFE